MKEIYFPSAFILSAFLLAWVAPITADEISEMERDTIALEFYLQDKKDHEEYCPSLSWTQPSLEVYKEKLTSQLPEECKE
jgi:hypothetical protein